MNMRVKQLLMGVLWIAACEQNSNRDSSEERSQAQELPPNLSEPPPNAPPPPAECGDMNGGGDQHVDFDALVAAKTAEKPEVEMRQQQMLELR